MRAHTLFGRGRTACIHWPIALALGALTLLPSLAAAAQKGPPEEQAPVIESQPASDGAEAEQATAEGLAATDQRGTDEPAPPIFPGPHGAIEFDLGILALPDAKVCSDSRCDRGDVSLEVDAWPLFRASRHFAVGAGLTLAFLPIQNAPRRATDTPRDSSRSYFMAEGMGRYYFGYTPTFESWCGLSGGLVVVSENFRTNSESSEIALIASKGANIATEGLSLGLAAGISYRVSRQVAFGGMLRVTNWFLPSEPETIAFGDKASLSGRITMINLAIGVSYAGRQ